LKIENNNYFFIDNKMNKEFTKDQLIEFFELNHNHYIKISEFRKKNKKNIRLPNFPEGLSENIIKFFIINKEKNMCRSNITCDLIVNDNILVEVKCFASSGPTSFGPKEKWDHIYFLDAIDFKNKKFKIYKSELSNTSNEWKNIQISKIDKYNDVCIKGKRPRIKFDFLKNQLNTNNKQLIKLVFEGKLDDIFN
jgi:hypothetical protein